MTYSRLIDPSGKASERLQLTQRGVRALIEDSENIDNQLGRWYMVGKFYAAWVANTFESGKKLDAAAILKVGKTTRGDMGLSENEKQPLDLLFAIDSVFNKVEAMSPACADSTRNYRSLVYTPIYAQARTFLDRKIYDTTVLLARRALDVDPKAAAPWNLIAEAEMLRGNNAGYRDALRKVAEFGSADPNAKKVVQQAYYNLGVLTLTDAQKVTDEAKQKEMAAEAVGYLKQFLAGSPDDPQGIGAYARALKLSGDTAQANALFNKMLTDPTKFTAAQLFGAGVEAFGAQRYDDAITSFRAGLVKNQCNRDGLFNLANSYNYAKQFDSAFAAFPKLLAVDPQNPDNFRLIAKTWQDVMKADANSPRGKIAIDSIINYIKLRDSSAVTVKFAPFTIPDRTDAAADAMITNRSGAPKTFQVTIEFLNAACGVVTSQTVTVPNVPAGQGMRFSVIGKGAGIVAYRYKPVS